MNAVFFDCMEVHTAMFAIFFCLLAILSPCFARNASANGLDRRAIPPGYTFKGCYETSAYPLNDRRGISYSGMTLRKCAIACEGLLYFGTIFGNECHCGDGLEGPQVIVDPSACDIPCTGNNRAGITTDEFCGAFNYMSVYERTQAIALVDPIVRYIPIGCYSEYLSLGLETEDAFLPNVRTIQHCEALCEGFNYFGLKRNGDSCICGEQIDSKARIASPEVCDQRCNDDGTQICGSSTSNHIVLYAAPKFPACRQLNNPLRIRNPGFENGVISWEAIAPDGKVQWQAVRDSNILLGRRAARISSRQSGSEINLSQYDIELCPGTAYILSFWALGTNCIAQSAFRRTPLINTVSDPTWRRYEAYVTTPVEVGYISFVVSCTNVISISKFYLDDVELRPATADDNTNFPPLG